MRERERERDKIRFTSHTRDFEQERAGQHHSGKHDDELHNDKHEARAAEPKQRQVLLQQLVGPKGVKVLLGNKPNWDNSIERNNR